MPNADLAREPARRSSAHRELAWGIALIVAGLAMRLGHGLVDLPFNLARTGETLLCVGVLCLAYGGWLLTRRD